MNAVERLKADEERRDSEVRPVDRTVVYTHAPVLFGRVLSRVSEGRFLCRIGAAERELDCDESVDPELIEEARKNGSRVLIDQADEALIAGIVQTQRALTIDRHGIVDAEVEELRVTSKRRTLLKAPGAFLDLSPHEVELYANRVVARARETARILATMIKLN